MFISSKMSFFLFCLIFIFSVSGGKIRRQIWPNLPSSSPDKSSSIDFNNSRNIFIPRDQTSREVGRFPKPENNFEMDGGRRRGNDRQVTGINNGNQNSFQTDRGRRPNGSNNQNQNGITTTQRPTTPERMGTIHINPEGCSCSFTTQFNPVCGTDGNTYRNGGLLNCHRQCGMNVTLKRMGTC